MALEIALPLLDYHNKTDSTKLIAETLLKFEILPKHLQIVGHVILAGYYDENEVHDSSLYHVRIAAHVDSLRGDSMTIPYTFFDYANFLLNDNQYELALEKMLYGMSFLREEDEFKRFSFNIGLADVYFKIGNIKKSETLTLEALAYAQKKNINRLMLDSYNQLGSIEAYYNNWEKSLLYFEKADSVYQAKSKILFKGLSAKLGTAEAKLRLGRSLTSNEIKEFETYRSTIKSEKLINKIDFLFLRINDHSIQEFEAKYAELIEQSEVKNADHMQIPLLELKKDFYLKKGDFKKAIILDDEISSLSKKITQANNEYIIQELDAKYQKQIQDKEINYLNTQNENKSKILVQQRWTIIIGAIALVLGAILLTMLYRLLKKVNKQKSVITKALSDKDILIKEIHHRVKNNLQLVSSLLTLQSRDIDDEKAKSAIQDGKSRVRSMALIHQDLYMKETLKDINVKDYLEKLTKDLFLTYKLEDTDIKLKLDIDDIDLDVDTVVPLGLIINELITNSLKYAFNGMESGILEVSLKKNQEKLSLKISDNGAGFNTENVRDDAFGTTMIKALTRQLKGEMNTESSDGTKTTLIFPHN